MVRHQLLITALVVCLPFAVLAAEPAPLVAPAPVNVEEPAAAPPRVDIERLDLGDLLGHSLKVGDVGSFGVSLGEQKASIEFHGFMTMDFRDSWEHLNERSFDELRATPTRDLGNTLFGASYFDMHHAALVSRANIADRVYPEVAFLFSHAGDIDSEELKVPWAFVDFRVADWLVIRAGKMPVSIGAVNEYRWADFMRTTAALPLLNTDLIPGFNEPWSEVGVQARGRVDLGKGRLFNYSLYVVNGALNQGDERDEAFVEGGDIKDFQGEYTFTKVADKAVGFRLGLTPLAGLDLGISGYTGRYTMEGRRRIAMLDADFSLEIQKLLLRGEMLVAQQEISGALVDRLPLMNSVFRPAAYLMLAYRLASMCEAYAQWDVLSRVDTMDRDGMFASLLDSAKTRALAGVAIYPLPVQAPRTVAKAELSFLGHNHGHVSMAFQGQLTVGF